MTELDIVEMIAADRAATQDHSALDAAFAAIYAVLNVNSQWGWEDWFAAAADGAWS